MKGQLPRACGRSSYRPMGGRLAFLVVLAAAAPAFGGERLTLRLNDTDTRPGAEAALVIRTYASRPLDEGQVCLRAPFLGEGVGGEIFTLNEVVVFSELGDAVVEVDVDTSVSPPAIIIGFSSVSGTINRVDGPLAVVYLDVDPNAPVGLELDLELDEDASWVIGDDGLPIELRTVGGRLRIRDLDQSYGLSAEGDQADIGASLVLGASTDESHRLRSGQVGLVLPPELRQLPRTVTIDPRFGNATVTVDDTDPELLVIGFSSPDASLGRMPGHFLQVALDTAGAASGSWPVALEGASSFLIDASGALLELDLDDDQAQLFGEGFFVGDFELGDLSLWSFIID